MISVAILKHFIKSNWRGLIAGGCRLWLLAVVNFLRLLTGVNWTRLFAWGNPLRLLAMVLIFAINSNCFSQNNLFSGGNMLSAGAKKLSLNEARKMVDSKDYPGAVRKYSELLADDSLNVTFIVESAHALALCGYMEGALLRLDRIWRSGEFVKRDVIPLVKNTLLLTGSPTFRRIFGTDKMAEIPIKGMSSPGKEAFLRANFLVSSGEFFQAIYLFDNLIASQPDNLAYQMGLITALEKLGSNTVAKEMLTELVSKLRDNKSDQKTISILENHIKTLDKSGKNNAINFLMPAQPQTMAYLGMMLAPSYSNISGKLGYFLSDTYNASFDISLNEISDIKTFNTGITIYQRKNSLIYGLGLTYSSGQAKNLYYKISAGYSIPNKNRTSSLDLFCDFNMGFNKSTPVMFGVSIGKSFYFGKRK